MPYTPVHGKQVYYEVQGDGPPLVILNGIMMSTSSWEPLLPNLTKNNLVVLLDFLDQGQSDQMDEPYDQGLQVEVVKAVLDELELERVNLLGISYGGEVALQFAAQNCSRLEKLLLFNTCAFTTPWLKDIGNLWKKTAATGDAELYYYSTIPLIYSPEFYARNYGWMTDRKDRLEEKFNHQFLAAQTRLIDSAEPYDVRNELARIMVQTLVVGSDYDFITPIPNQLLINDLLPNSEFTEIRDSGHASMYEQPTMFLNLVQGFLATDQLSVVHAES